MIRKIYFLIVLTMLSLSMLTSEGHADFQKGVRDFNALKQNDNRAQYRSHWIDIAEIFQRSLRADPKGENAPESLFYLGRTYEELGKRSFLRSDFEKAEQYYDQVIKNFPKSTRGDEAQFRKAGIHLNHYNDSAQAYLEYLKVVYNFSNGSMRSKAQEVLKELDQANLEKIKKSSGSTPAPTVSESPSQETQPSPIESRTIEDESPAYSSLPPSPSISSTEKNPDSSKHAQLVKIRHWSNDEYTRVVLDLDNQADYYHKLLKPDQELGTPHRLFIDLNQTQVAESTPREENVADGILRRIRSAQHTQDKSRVVLDIQDLDNFRVFALENPFRVVVDVYAPEKQAPRPVQTSDAIAQVTLDAENKDMTAKSLVEQLGLKVKTIMIDAGHGGKDPGAVYKDILEKNIVLKMSKVLGNMLKEKGFEVLYTRTTDVFVPLEERTAMANSKNVDLFISVHANAHRNRKIRGFEVYYLNFAQTEDAMRVAARENAISTQKISDLQYILTDLMLSSKINESRELATKIYGVTIDHVRSKYSGVNDNGIRQAPFYVLMGARMPSILVEMGYMTNDQDLKLLLSDQFINHMAGGLTKGIVSYREKIEKFARLD
ncbi:MAG: N-acetylmuramoyl-L-alanine amidase [Desulfonatronovibrio sp.]|nr:N-acetylmuramoyl-L-alanine amidase [Desulfovibrionales bacterium]